MKTLRTEMIEVPGGKIQIVLDENYDEEGAYYNIYVDGVCWLETENGMHATVLFEMMKDHITEYVHYEMRK